MKYITEEVYRAYLQKRRFEKKWIEGAVRRCFCWFGKDNLSLEEITKEIRRYHVNGISGIYGLIYFCDLFVDYDYKKYRKRPYGVHYYYGRFEDSRDDFDFSSCLGEIESRIEVLFKKELTKRERIRIENEVIESFDLLKEYDNDSVINYTHNKKQYRIYVEYYSVRIPIDNASPMDYYDREEMLEKGATLDKRKLIIEEVITEN